MHSTSVLIILPTCTLLFLILRQVRLWYRLRHIPGPISASFSDLWMLRSALGGNMWRDFGEACEKYGPVARVGPNEVVIEDLDGIRRTMAARSPYTRSNWATAFRFDPQRDSLINRRDSKDHDRIRAKMKAGYSGEEIPNLEDNIDVHLTKLMNLISAKYTSTESVIRPLDLAEKVQYFTLDVITHLAFGKEFGFLTNDTDVYDYIATVKSMLPLMSFFSVFPRLHAILRSYLVKKYILPSDKDPAGLGKVIGVAKSVVAERFKPDAKDEEDMLGSFVRHGLTQEEAEPEVLLQIVAGSDTTATCIRTTLLHLMTSPNAYAKLRAEIYSATLSSPVRESEAKKLPYLQAVIKEGLRMWPPIGAVMFKHAPSGGDAIAGVHIPEGTKVGVCWYGISRCKASYGEDSNVFRPERWLEAEGTRLESMERTNDLIFAPGKWGCLGKGLAFTVLHKVFVELLRRFDFQLIDPSRPIRTFHAGIHVQSDMWVRATENRDLPEKV